MSENITGTLMYRQVLKCSSILILDCCRALQCDAVCCSVLQCVAVWCSVMQCVAVCCSVLQCVAVCCSVSQCVAVCCSVLQCVAVCCSVLQCVAVRCSSIVMPYMVYWHILIAYLKCNGEFIVISYLKCSSISIWYSCSVLQCVAVCCSSMVISSRFHISSAAL